MAWQRQKSVLSGLKREGNEKMDNEQGQLSRNVAVNERRELYREECGGQRKLGCCFNLRTVDI